MSQALILAAGAETAHELPMQPLMFALIAMITFVSLLGLTWSFRGSANKHR